MNEYLIIIKILNLVYTGKNLNEVLSDYINEKQLPKIKNICYGVLRNYFSINYSIKKLAKHTNNELNLILQIAIFEIDNSKKPIYAIINDSVNLIFEITKKESLKKFINGVLREYTRQKEIIKIEIDKDYSLKYNLPNWMINKLKIQQKLKYKEILENFNYHPAFGLRVNHKKCSNLEYFEKLKQNNLDFVVLDNKIALTKAVNINELPGFYDGLVSVQDIAAQSVIDILQTNKINPLKVLDVCAAPGGKTCQILENYTTSLLALDINEKRLGLVKQNLMRLNLSANLQLADACSDRWWDGEIFDFILADVPCSASGTIKRNPDIKINRFESDLDSFVMIQRKIIANIWKMLAPRGFLLYITCSIFDEENKNNIDWFKFNLEKFVQISDLQILPSLYNDSLYYALIQKSE